MPATVVDAVHSPFPCACRCHERLALDERAAGIEALYCIDDAMRGWGYTVLWDLAAPALWRIQQQLADPRVRWVAVRDTPCIHARLVGYCIHETIHALCGDPAQANFGVPVGLPYGVPEDVPVGAEAAYLHPFNEMEARAWVGLAPVARRFFGIEWEVLPAREVGTYGLPGGNALVDVPPGFRRVAHYDDVHHPRRYHALAARLQDEARAWFTEARLDALYARFVDAEARGRAQRPSAYPPPRVAARRSPRWPGRNDLCLCGSMAKWKQCCGPRLEGQGGAA